MHSLPISQLVVLFYRVSKQELLWSYGLPGPVPVAWPRALFFNEPVAILGVGVDENALLPDRYRRDLLRSFLSIAKLQRSSAAVSASCSEDLVRISRFFEFLFHLWQRTRTKTPEQMQNGAFTIQRLEYLVRSLLSRRFLNGSVPSARLVEDFMHNQMNDPRLKLFRLVTVKGTGNEPSASEPLSAGGSDLESAASRRRRSCMCRPRRRSPTTRLLSRPARIC